MNFNELDNNDFEEARIEVACERIWDQFYSNDYNQFEIAEVLQRLIINLFFEKSSSENDLREYLELIQYNYSEVKYLDEKQE